MAEDAGRQGQRRSVTGDGLAALAIVLLTVALIALVVTRLVS